LNTDESLRDDLVLISAFVFGRRICPGRHFIDTTLFISLLSVLNFERRKGRGRPSDYGQTLKGKRAIHSWMF
jgi:hypothetical protein